MGFPAVRGQADRGATNAATISSKRSAAIRRISACGRPSIGWGRTTIGRAAQPRPVAEARARLAKASVTTTTAGVPANSVVTESWTLHDVQEPQVPRPTMATSTARAKSTTLALSASGVPMRVPGSKRTTSARSGPGGCPGGGPSERPGGGRGAAPRRDRGRRGTGSGSGARCFAPWPASIPEWTATARGPAGASVRFRHG